MNSMQPSPSIRPSIRSSSKRHTRKIININPIKKFITRNLTRSHPPLQSSVDSTTLKSLRIHQGPKKELKIPSQKPSSQVYVSTINTCKAKAFIMQKTSYRNKQIINQEILDKIRNRQTPKLGSFINNKRRSHQMHINIFEKDVESISVRIMGSTRKTRRGYVV